MFKSDFDDLTVEGASSDSIYRRKDCNFNHAWVSYIDLRHEREHGDSIINRRFRLHTPYTEDVELTVPGKNKELQQAIYEYKVRVLDYFPLRIAGEVDLICLKDYFGLRLSVGKRLGGYLSVKLGDNKKGFNVDEEISEVDMSQNVYTGRIRNSYLAGVKYGIASRNNPIYLFAGAGYGDVGSQRSNGKKICQGRIDYYNNYTSGFESEIGVNLILFDFLSVSIGADAIFGHRVAFEMNCTLGFAVDLTK